MAFVPDAGQLSQVMAQSTAPAATYLALTSGICTALLLVVGFASAYLGIRHEYGAGLLFAVAISLLGAALFKFGQEVRLGLSEADHYR
jgi:hypothetical protein